MLGIILMLAYTNRASSTEYILDLASAFFSILHSHGTNDNFIYKTAPRLGSFLLTSVMLWSGFLDIAQNITQIHSKQKVQSALEALMKHTCGRGGRYTL